MPIKVLVTLDAMTLTQLPLNVSFCSAWYWSVTVTNYIWHMKTWSDRGKNYRKDDKITTEKKHIEGPDKTRLYVAFYRITTEKSLNLPIPGPTQSF